MITCKLGNKNYTVDFVSGRALREMEPATQMYSKLMRMSQKYVENEMKTAEGEKTSEVTVTEELESVTISEALDTMVKWFCVLFANQFTPDEVYDLYPADRLMHDIALAIMAVQSQATEVLDTFPTIPIALKAVKA